MSAPESDSRSLHSLAAGCAGTSGPVDTDGDGLLDSYEMTIGTNPKDADTDGDGWTDSEAI